MSVDTLVEFNREAVQSLTEGYRLVLLSPRFRSRNTLMTWFLQSDQTSYFYSLRPDDTTLHQFLENLNEGFRDFDPKFGQQLGDALEQSKVKPADLADALIADLGRAKPKPQYLVLDNFDFLHADEDAYRLFHRVVENLPRGIQLVINSRELAFKPWNTLIRSGEAIMLADDKTLDGGIYEEKTGETPQLEVYGFGGGSVYVDGIALNTWDGPLPRNLFYYFIDHPMVTRDEIFATFWPELPAKEATNVFHVTKRKVSERLGYELTTYAGGFYRPSEQLAIHYDVARFEETIEQCSQEHEPTSPEAWYRAIKLYRSPFLYGIEMPWIEQRREKLRLEYAQALIGVARLYKALDDSERAISYYLRALREVPQREDVHRDVMTLFEGRGERDKAIAQYKWLSDTLKRTLNISPSKTTRGLYDMLIGKK